MPDLIIADEASSANSTQPRQTASGQQAGSGVEETPGVGQNYPNPFNPVTTIRYALPEASTVTLAVYDVMGRQVARLVDSSMNAGTHEATFDASGLPSGVYFYRIQAGSFMETRRMVLMK